MGDPTPAEIEAGVVAAVQAIWGDETYGDLIAREFLPDVAAIATRAALGAVLPDRDARVRAKVAEQIAWEIERLRPHIPPSDDPARKYAVAARDTANRAARIARQHTTGGDHD